MSVVKGRAIGEQYTYSCGAELDGFERVFYLEEAAFGGEGAKAADLIGYQSEGRKSTYFMPRSEGTISYCLTCCKLGEMPYHILTVL